MSGPETNFYNSVHRYLPPSDELYRVKTHNPYTAGIADFWYSKRKDLWVEYKFITLPKRDTTIIDLTARSPKTDPDLSVLQQDWLNSRYVEGRNVWVIVGCKEGGVILKDMAWMEAHPTKTFRSRILSRDKVAEAIRSFVESK